VIGENMAAKKKAVKKTVKTKVVKKTVKRRSSGKI
jgi:hypothetical protein